MAVRRLSGPSAAERSAGHGHRPHHAATGVAADLLALQRGAVVAHPNPNAALTGFVAQVNRLPAEQRRDAAAPYVWNDGDKTAFVTTFNTGIRDRWSEKHEFHATREHWTDLGATVDADSAMHPGEKGDDEHVSLTAYKTPPGGADLDAAGQARLNQIGATFRGGGPGCRICGVTITASSGGPLLTFRVEGATEAAARTRYGKMLQALSGGGNLDIVLRDAAAAATPRPGRT